MSGTTADTSESKSPGLLRPEESQAQEPGPTLSYSDNLLVNTVETTECEVLVTKDAEADDLNQNDQDSASQRSLPLPYAKMPPKYKLMMKSVLGTVLRKLLDIQKKQKVDTDLRGNTCNERDEGIRRTEVKTDDSKGENDGELSDVQTEGMPNNNSPDILKKKKKKLHQNQEDPKTKRVSAGKKRNGSESESGRDINRKQKRKSRESQPTHKKPKYGVRDEDEDSIQNVGKGSDSRCSSDVFNEEKKSISSYTDRKRAYDNFPIVQDILKTFPEVSNYRILKRDYEKLCKVDLQTLERKLEKTLIVAYYRHFKNKYISPDPVIAAAVKHNKRRLDNKEMHRDIQMLCFCYQKSDGKLNGTFYRQRSKEGAEFVGVSPTIDIQDALGSRSCKITVYCDNVKFTQVPTFFDGVFCAYAIYHIFNINYDKTAQGIFESFDSLIAK